MLALSTTFNAVQAKPLGYAVYQQYLTKSGKPDKRYNENKHLKKDGTMDMRYKSSKKAAKKKTK
jgi:alpha-beta hydrolase superfamily lysophospholipase